MTRILEKAGLAAMTITLSMMVIVGQRRTPETVSTFVKLGASLAGEADERGNESTSLVTARALGDAHADSVRAASTHSTAEEHRTSILNLRMMSRAGVSRLIIDLDRAARVRCSASPGKELSIFIEDGSLTEQARSVFLASSDAITFVRWRVTPERESELNVGFPSAAQYQIARLSGPERIVVDFSLPHSVKFARSESETVPALWDAGTNTAGALGLKLRRVVIDPGHGGPDAGAVGPGGLTEKQVALAVATRLKQILEEEYGIEALLTRNSDHAVSLERRAEFANQNGADLFLSIHANACDTGADANAAESRGVEAFWLSLTGSPDAMQIASRENRSFTRRLAEMPSIVRRIAMTQVGESSRLLARQLLSSLSREIAAIEPEAGRNRGTRTAPFAVLVGAIMPAVLIELPFISNSRDEALLQNASFRERLARGLAKAISTSTDATSLARNR